MSERTYQVIIGVLVLIIIAGGAYMLAAQRPASSMNISGDDMTSSSTGMTMQEGSTGTSATAPSMTVKENGTGTSQAPMQAATVTAQGDTVSVVDQPAGNSVAVADVTLTQAGWVAVRDSSGNTLGAGWFPAGEHQSVEVPLLRATKSGQTYEAVLYYDSTNNHVFSLTQDSLVMRPDGSMLSAAFLAK